MGVGPKSASALGVSISDSPDLGALGLSAGHLRDATAELALLALSSGWSLAYGGDLRRHGFTTLLAELVARYRGHPSHDATVSVTDYLAWPVHIGLSSAELAAFVDAHEPAVQLVYLSLDGGRLAPGVRLGLDSREPTAEEWKRGLSTMRSVMRDDIRGRIVLGGRVDGYKGDMPGIAEETWLSLQTGQPVFLLGGFGGCARDIAETVGLAEPWAGLRDGWPGRERFRDCSPADLRNGLSVDENCTLARTPHIDEAVSLVSRGLRGLFGNGGPRAQGVHQPSSP